MIGPETPEHKEEWLRRWPVRKFPLLLDKGRDVVESSVIIEYLQLYHPGPARLLARPSFARAVDEARPFRPNFPLGAPDRD